MIAYRFAASLMASCLTAAPQQPVTATLQLPNSWAVRETSCTDVDADGKSDLVLACYNEANKRRQLRIHLRDPRSGRFAASPSREPIPLDRDVVAFAFVELAADPGRELVLFTSEQAVWQRLAGDQDNPNTRLFRHSLVWPAATDRCVALTDAVDDFDGDGAEDLLLPGPNAWSLWRQLPSDSGVPKFAAPRTLQLPTRRATLSRNGGSNGSVAIDREGLQLRFGQGTGSGGPLVSLSARTPPRAVLDLDGDGARDIACYRNGSTYSTSLGEAPTSAASKRATSRITPIQREMPLPLPQDRLTTVDPTFDVRWHDVDADGTPELVLITSAQRDGSIEARIDLFGRNSDGGIADKRTIRLRTQPHAIPVQFVDANGNGRADLVCVTLRTSSLPSLPGSDSGTAEVQLNIFGNDGSSFQKQALLLKPLPLSKNAGRFSRPFLRVRPGRRGFPGDVLLHAGGGGGELEQRLLKADGDALELGKTIARVAIPDDFRIVALDPLGDDLLLVADHEVRHVRFRR
ncbi:MAG: FG-GAP repeat domain-containing protein [Planctomycetota bacterium]